MDHTRSQSSHGREFFSTRDRAICFHAISDLFADSNHVRYRAAVVGPHRDLTNHPVTDITLRRWSFLFDAFDLTALKHTRKLFFQHITRLARQYFKYVPAEH